MGKRNDSRNYFENGVPLTLDKFRELTAGIPGSVLLRAYQGESTGIVLETKYCAGDIGFIEARGEE